MALKFECDGCGALAKSDEHFNMPAAWRKVMVDIDSATNSSLAVHKFDLCSTCSARFLDQFPSNWPRAKPAKESA